MTGVALVSAKAKGEEEINRGKSLNLLTTLVCMFLASSLPKLRSGALAVVGRCFCREVVATRVNDAAARSELEVVALRKIEENSLYKEKKI